VSIKDLSLLIPLVILNACLTFSWPNNVPFDRKASGTIWADTNLDWQTGAEGGMMGGTKSEPKGRLGPDSWQSGGPWVLRSMIVIPRCLPRKYHW
jgi:hypothetical protein